MISYAFKIKHLYPNATDKDFRLQDNSDGQGVFISFWNTGKLGIKPTLTQLDSQVSDNIAIDTALDSKKEGKFDQDTVKALGLTMKDFINEVITGRVVPITNSEFKNKFKSYL